MPIWMSSAGDRVALPSAEDVVAWERVQPGLAGEILTEIKIARRHARAQQWAQIAVECLPSAGKIVAVLSIWHVTDPLSAQHPASPVIAAAAVAIAVVASGPWPTTRPRPKR